MQIDYKIAVLPGDGIGPEVIAEAVRVLSALAEQSDLNFEFNYADVGGCAVDNHSTPLPETTLDLCKASDAVLMGAIGGIQYDELPGYLRPERGLLDLRKGLGLFANLRPARVYPALASASTLKTEFIENVDILIVRELTGGIYFGEPQEINEAAGEARSTMVYHKHEIERIARIAFEAARKRQKRVCSVDKANVLDVSKYWRKIVRETLDDYPDIELNHMYVDNCAMQLVRFPAQFDVIVTGNMFGDILSDEASMLTGSLGMLPSASLGEQYALYEPVHGSAPDIAGKGMANPIAAIASAALMLQYTLNRPDLAAQIESAIEKALNKGRRTADIAMNGETPLSTSEMGQEIVKYL